MEFFHQVYHLQYLSKATLKSRLLPCFVLQYYQINQVVFSQGDQPKNVFVAFEGEFEIVKRVKDNTVVDETEIDEKSMNSNRLFSNCRRKDITLKLARVTKGQVIGFNDLINNQPHSTTVRCVTTKGSLYSIDGEELVSKLKKDRKSWLKLL